MSRNNRFRTYDSLVTSVTALPTGSDRYDGRMVDYHPSGSLATGPIYRCVWKSAMNSGNGEWRVIGPSGNLSHDSGRSVYTGPITTTSATYTAVSGPSISIPINGQYKIEWGGQFWVTGATAAGMISLSGAGYTASDDFAIVIEKDISPVYSEQVYRTYNPVLTAGTLSLQWKRVSGTGTLNLTDRYIYVTPVRFTP